MSEWIRWAIGLAAPPVMTLMVWLVYQTNSNKREIIELKLHVAENYAKNEAMRQVFDELRKLSKVVYEIAGKLNVPINRD